MATLTQMGIPNSGFGILHPKMANRWQVSFVNLSSLVPSANSRDITRQATNFQRPTLEFEQVTMHRYNSTAYVAGKYTWSPVTLTVEDDITGLASAAITGQLETQQRLIGADLPGQYLNAAATGSDYKFGTVIEMLDGNTGVVETWKLEGCFFTRAEFGTLDYNSSEAMTIAVEIRFDHARHVLNGAGYGTALGGAL